MALLGAQRRVQFAPRRDRCSARSFWCRSAGLGIVRSELSTASRSRRVAQNAVGDRLRGGERSLAAALGSVTQGYNCESTVAMCSSARSRWPA